MKNLFLIVSIILVVILQTACPDPITSEITVIFEGPNGERLPASRVTVHLWDKLYNKEWNGITDMDGKVSFTFDSQPSGLDAMIYFKNDQLSLTSDTDCDSHPITIGETVDPQLVSELRIAVTNFAQIKAWYYLNQANVTAVEDLGANMFPVKACMAKEEDKGSLFRMSTQTIILKLAGFGLDEKLYHEYGHAVMYKAVGGSYDNRDCLNHFIQQRPRPILNPTCAWIEGWADFYAVRTKLKFSPNTSTTFLGVDIEKYDSENVGNNGYKDEGRVAAGLWDLYDEPDDSFGVGAGDNKNYGSPCAGDMNSNKRVTVRQMLESMSYLSFENTVRSFNTKLSPKLSGETLEKANLIMQYNWLLKDAICN